MSEAFSLNLELENGHGMNYNTHSHADQTAVWQEMSGQWEFSIAKCAGVELHPSSLDGIQSKWAVILLVRMGSGALLRWNNMDSRVRIQVRW